MIIIISSSSSIHMIDIINSITIVAIVITIIIPDS